MRKAILMLLLAVTSSSAMAGIVIQANSVALQTQIDRNEGGFKSCGVRGVVVTTTKNYLDAYDFLLMARADMPHGTLNAGKLQFYKQTTIKGKGSSEVVTPPPIKFWLVQGGESNATRPMKITPTETEGYILELANLKDTLRRIRAMVNGERMRLVVRYKNQPADVVINFSAAIPAIERTPLLECLSEVTKKSLGSDQRTKN